MTDTFVNCPVCWREKADFLIVDGRCDACRKAERRAAARPPVPGWAEVRDERDRRLAASDWTQLPDVPEATRERWRDHRQALRDITRSFETPADVVWPDPPA